MLIYFAALNNVMKIVKAYGDTNLTKLKYLLFGKLTSKLTMQFSKHGDLLNCKQNFPQNKHY